MSWKRLLKYDSHKNRPLVPQRKKAITSERVEMFANAVADLLDNNKPVIKLGGEIFDINNPQHLIRMARKGHLAYRFDKRVGTGFELNKPENMNLFMIVMGQRGYN